MVERRIFALLDYNLRLIPSSGHTVVTKIDFRIGMSQDIWETEVCWPCNYIEEFYDTPLDFIIQNSSEKLLLQISSGFTSPHCLVGTKTSLRINIERERMLCIKGDWLFTEDFVCSHFPDYILLILYYKILKKKAMGISDKTLRLIFYIWFMKYASLFHIIPNDPIHTTMVY